MAGIRQVGDWIDGRFEVYDVHVGGMGVVYVAYDHKGTLGRRVVALKTLRDEFLHDEPLARRFVAECEAWVRLERHLHIVRAYAILQLEGRPYVVMELVTGGTLREWIGTPRLDLPQALRFGIQFCLGLEHAVRKGLRCHRDIKPENLMVTEGGTLKVTDFGLAKVRDLDARDDDRLAPIPLVEITDVEPLPSDHAGPDRSARASTTAERDAPRGNLPSDHEAPGGHSREPRNSGRSATEKVDANTAAGLPPGPVVDPFAAPAGDMPSPTSPAVRDSLPTGEAGPGEATSTETQLAPETARLTPSGQWIGTPFYSSPEQFREAGSVDWKTDLYAFGVVLHEMIAGHRPFRGKTLGEIKRLHASAPPPSIRPWVPVRYRRVARRLDRIVRRCLEKEPEQRFHSFGELRRALSKCLWRATGEEVTIPGAAELDAWDFTGRGVSLGTLGRHEEELESYEEALSYNVEFVPAWFNQAAALGDLGRWDDAVRAADAALALNPRSVPALLNKGLALHSLGSTAEALTILDAAVALGPLDPVAWHRRGLVHRDLGDEREFRADMLRALKLCPTLVEALYALNPESSPRPRNLHRAGPDPADPRPEGDDPEPIPFVRRLEDTAADLAEGHRRSGFRFWR